MKIPSWEGQKALAFGVGLSGSDSTHPCAPEAVKKFKTGQGREGEAPAEPHGQGVARVMARQEARPPNFFTPSLRPRRMYIFIAIPSARQHALAPRLDPPTS